MKARICWIAVLTMFVLITACSKKEDVVQSGGTAPPAVDSKPDGKRLDALVDQVVADAADLPHAEFDPAALARALGKDPQNHFEWVRDHTFWAPYRGLLRGSRGVMLDRVGSNLDRAVLLGELLRRSGHTVRLAHAQMPESLARELLAKVRPIPDQRRAPVAPKAASGDRQKAIEAVSPHREQEVEKQLAETRRRTTEAEALIRSQSDALLAAVRGAMSLNQSDEGAAFAAFRDHWWVERADGDKWIAMDVLLPDGAPGQALTAAATTSNWPAEQPFPAVPEADWHSVDLRVVVERHVGGATTESTVLESTLRPAEVFGQPVTLAHVPAPWPEQLPDPAADPQPLREAALHVKLWMPVLHVGNEQIFQSGFTVGGELETNLVDSLRDIAKVGGAEVVSGMDMALGGFGAEETTPSATAEWIDYVIRVPGAPSQQLRRPVFDLLGPARRASKSADFDGTAELRTLERFEALWAQTDILLQPCELTDEFVAHLATKGLVSDQQALKELAREGDAAKAQKLSAEILGRIELWGPLPNLVLWRSALGGQAAGSYIGRTNVLQYRAGRTVLNPTHVQYRELIDVAANPVSARRGAGNTAFEARLRQGVADTVAEMLTLGNELGMAENTASVFGRLAAEGSRGMVIAANDVAAAKALPWPDDELARVAADVNAGYMVVVPRKAVLINEQQRVGWWRIDPASGETIGVMDNGFHAAAVQKALATLLIPLLPFLNNQALMQRVDRIRESVNHRGTAGWSSASLSLLRLIDNARVLQSEVELMARRAAGGG